MAIYLFCITITISN